MPRSKEELQDLKIARSMQEMMLTEGWKSYALLLDHHIKMKTNQALAPVDPFTTQVDGITQVLCGEAAKGAIMGLRLALSLPSGIVAQQIQNFPSLAGDEE